MKRELLFVQGGGQGTHDKWDNELVGSLRLNLGQGYRIHYPRMPSEDDPSYALWKTALEGEFESLQDGAAKVAGRATISSCLPTLVRGFPKASPSTSFTGLRMKSRHHRTSSSTPARFRKLASIACGGATIGSIMTMLRRRTCHDSAGLYAWPEVAVVHRLTRQLIPGKELR